MASKGQLAAAKRRGATYEIEIEEDLKTSGLPGQRIPKAGANDKGDIHVYDWAIECKAEKSINLAQYLREAEVERGHADKRWCAALVRRRGTSNRDEDYVVMTYKQFKQLLAELNNN